MVTTVNPLNMPQDVRRALDLFGLPLRSALLNELRRAGPSICSELARATGAPLSSVRSQIDRLEAAGLIEREPDERVVGGVVRTRYRLDEEALLRLAALVAGYLTGSTGSR